MSNIALTQTFGVYLNIPRTDRKLFNELVKKFGWVSETREDVLREFLADRPNVNDITEGDIMDEVKTVRYCK